MKTKQDTTIITTIDMSTRAALRDLEQHIELKHERLVDRLDRIFTTTDMTQATYDQLQQQLTSWVGEQVAAIQTLQRTLTILESTTERDDGLPRVTYVNDVPTIA
jgi:hypothetical protein